ncbi:MAG: hypothetical protein ACK515_08690 [bacterium]|jgi:hypothetical protein|nr:hypothetical protein [Betaproteobacteria bacterium]
MLAKALQKTPLVFFRSSGGNEPVRDWLKALDASVKKTQETPGEALALARSRQKELRS